MAEIPIERKERSNLWPLILGALALLLLLGYCFTRRDAEPTTAAADTAGVADTSVGAAAGVAAGGSAGAVGEFAQFVTARDTASETEGNHQYTAEGVRRLAVALEAVAGGNPSIGLQADSMRSSVQRMQQSSASADTHADDARAAFNAAVSAMEMVDRARGRTRDVAPMRAIAQELSPGQPLMPQLGVVHRFFEAARDALQAMGAA